MVGVGVGWFRREVSRRRPQNVVGPPQLAVLPLELSQPLRFAGLRAWTDTTIDLGLPDPVTQSFGMHPETLGHPVDCTVVGVRVRTQLDGHPRGTFSQLVGELPGCCHDSHPPWIESLHRPGAIQSSGYEYSQRVSVVVRIIGWGSPARGLASRFAGARALSSEHRELPLQLAKSVVP